MHVCHGERLRRCGDSTCAVPGAHLWSWRVATAAAHAVSRRCFCSTAVLILVPRSDATGRKGKAHYAEHLKHPLALGPSVNPAQKSQQPCLELYCLYRAARC